MLRLVVAGALLALSASPGRATTPSYSMVSGYAREKLTPGQTYFLAPSVRSQEGSLEFESFSKLMDRALGAKGLVRVGDPAKANILVLMDYGIGPPQKEVGSYSIPTFGQTGVSGASTTGRVSGSGTVTARTTYTPTFGITGSSTSTYTYTTYDRWFRLSAYGMQSDSKNALWQTEVKSSGSTGDLRTVLPQMIYASANYIGVDTGKAVRVKVKESSKEFKAFWKH